MLATSAFDHRRTLLKAAAIGGGCIGMPTASAAPLNFRMPDEAEPHKATWMAYTDSSQIWGKRLLTKVQNTLANLANTIVRFEPVNLLVNAHSHASAKAKLDPRVTLIVTQIDDLWIRDTGCVFVRQDKGQRAAINFNFNGWGLKQRFTHDREVASFMALQSGVALRKTHLVLEGGALEVDGRGSAILTESCVLHAKRNPNLSRAQCEQGLSALLGIKNFIWLPGIAGRDITDGHTDFYARFTQDGSVVAHFDPFTESYDHAITLRHLEILRQAKDASGASLKVEVLEAPHRTRQPDNSTFTAGYVNFYVCNGAVIMPEFGDTQYDGQAQHTLSRAYPGREIVALNIDPIAEGGGGIHCATQQEIA